MFLVGVGKDLPQFLSDIIVLFGFYALKCQLKWPVIGSSDYINVKIELQTVYFTSSVCKLIRNVPNAHKRNILVAFYVIIITKSNV